MLYLLAENKQHIFAWVFLFLTCFRIVHLWNSGHVLKDSQPSQSGTTLPVDWLTTGRVPVDWLLAPPHLWTDWLLAPPYLWTDWLLAPPYLWTDWLLAPPYLWTDCWHHPTCGLTDCWHLPTCGLIECWHQPTCRLTECWHHPTGETVSLKNVNAQWNTARVKCCTHCWSWWNYKTLGVKSFTDWWNDETLRE